MEILDLIDRITPVTEPEAKRGLYRIRDPFFNFWFGLVRPNKRQLELGLEKNVWHNIREEFKAHLGRIFEDICAEVLVEMTKKNLLPIRLERIGKWWWKETEIDIVGLGSKGKRALAIEAKLTELNYQKARRLLSELAIKTKEIHDVRECILGVMAKKVENKEKIRSEGFIAFDLQDMANLRKHEN